MASLLRQQPPSWSVWNVGTGLALLDGQPSSEKVLARTCPRRFNLSSFRQQKLRNNETRFHVDSARAFHLQVLLSEVSLTLQQLQTMSLFTGRLNSRGRMSCGLALQAAMPLRAVECWDENSPQMYDPVSLLGRGPARSWPESTA